MNALVEMPCLLRQNLFISVQIITMITDFALSPNHKAMLLQKEVVVSSFYHLFCLCIVPSFIPLQKKKKNPTLLCNKKKNYNKPQKLFYMCLTWGTYSLSNVHGLETASFLPSHQDPGLSCLQWLKKGNTSVSTL